MRNHASMRITALSNLYLVAPVLVARPGGRKIRHIFFSANISNSGCSNKNQCAYGCTAVLSLMVITLLKLIRWFPLSKLEIIYLPPNIHSLTRRRLVGHNCKRKRRFWLRRYLLSRLPQIPPYLKDYCVIANDDRC